MRPRRAISRAGAERRRRVGPLCGALLLLLASGCNFALPPPAATETEAFTPTAATTIAPVLRSPEPLVETAMPGMTPATPGATATVTPTPGPWRHVMRQGETLGYIVQLYGYRDTSIFGEIVRLNESIANANLLPGEGNIILIPRQTATMLPQNFTPRPVFTLVGGSGPTPTLLPMLHVVEAGQSILDLAVQYDTTLEIMAILNPEVSFFGCNFTVASGGPNCNPLISTGQQVRVPAPPPTATLSPTPSGSETATPTPTWPVPQVIAPPEGATIATRSLRLRWVSVGILAPAEVYLLQLTDITRGARRNFVTRETSLLLPAELAPTPGQSHELHWTLSVARANMEGIYRIVSGVPAERHFRWQG